MPGPEEGAGGSSSAADRRSRQERRGRPHLPPELQEGEGEERGLPEDVGVPHHPARVRFITLVLTLHLEMRSPGSQI